MLSRSFSSICCPPTRPSDLHSHPLGCSPTSAVVTVAHLRRGFAASQTCCDPCRPEWAPWSPHLMSEGQLAAGQALLHMPQPQMCWLHSRAPRQDLKARSRLCMHCRRSSWSRSPGRQPCRSCPSRAASSYHHRPSCGDLACVHGPLCLWGHACSHPQGPQCAAHQVSSECGSCLPLMECFRGNAPLQLFDCVAVSVTNQCSDTASSSHISHPNNILHMTQSPAASLEQGAIPCCTSRPMRLPTQCVWLGRRSS